MYPRRRVLMGLSGLALAAALPRSPAFAANPGLGPDAVIDRWYRLILELVRHTATYTPPVAARAFAYVGVTLYEALATRPEGQLASLTGQVNALPAFAGGQAGLDPAAVAHGALCKAVHSFFFNTGPTGQRAMAAMQRQIEERLAETLPAPDLAAGIAHGEAVFDHVLAWSDGDGGAIVKNMGFPMTWDLDPRPGHWVPTNLIRLQQAPLLPDWGKTRPFCLPHPGDAELAPPVP